MTGQTYVRSLLRPALNADLIVSIHRVIQKGSDFISIESTIQISQEQFSAQWSELTVN